MEKSGSGEKKRIAKIVVYYRRASKLPERQLTGTPTTCAKKKTVPKVVVVVLLIVVVVLWLLIPKIYIKILIISA